MAWIQEIEYYIPSQRVDNVEQGKEFGLDQNFVSDKIGFKKLAKRNNNETIIDMAEKAVKKLQNNFASNSATTSRNALIFVSQNNENIIPHRAAILHERLGLLDNYTCFDLGQACSGYIQGIEVANALLTSGGFETILLVTSDSYSSLINDSDKVTRMLFADAATATLLSSRQGAREIAQVLTGTVPQTVKALSCNNGDSLKHDPQLALSMIMNVLPEKIQTFSQDISQFKKIIAHQGSKYLVRTLAKELNLEEEIVPFTSEHIGNTISSTIPIALKDHLTSQERILLCGFGGGLSWGLVDLKGS